jgi:hypothetical protein
MRLLQYKGMHLEEVVYCKRGDRRANQVSGERLGVLLLVVRDRIVGYCQWGIEGGVQLLLKVFIDFHDGGLISTSITVIWC